MKTEKVTLTDEYKKKLAGVLGFNVDASFKYVPKAYRENNIPKELWPVFTLTSKDGIEIAEAEDAIGAITYDKENNRTIKINSGSTRVQTLEAGIVSVKNFILEDGRSLGYDTEKNRLYIDGKQEDALVPVRTFIRYIPPALQVELQNAINERLTLTEEEVRGLE